ncbi:hypothetical protein D8674_008341 [Pyrus ussuriensis x Pyrus communis]|uniref:Uncharacterized protein n=1 Tax=Pyrus ussuriensis x Pyrus communis TaxID=2448454 RepID=A0A5N5HXB9_9ROSA|nr:hypothetical protein D8674_008341 [Pyrus ussuriensis x Pyrus communis]
MSNLISNSSSAATTSPPDMGMTGVSPVTPFGPTVSPALASSTSSVTHPLLSARQTHRQPRSSEEAEQSGEASSSWIVVPHEVKEAVLHELSPAGSLSGRLTSTSIMRNMTFPEIDMFNEVYVWSGDELVEQLPCKLFHFFSIQLSTMVEKGQTVLEEIMTDTLDQTLSHRQVHVHRGLGKVHLRDPSTSSSRERIKEIESLTSEVVDLKKQIAA